MTDVHDAKVTFQKKYLAIIVVLIIILIVTLSSLGYMYSKYRSSQKLLAETPLAAEFADEEIISKVDAIYKLPDDETPTMATVSDLEALGDQPFFRNAQQGHIVLIYQKNKLAVLYSPGENRVYEVGPLLQPSPTPGAILEPADEKNTIPTKKPLPTLIPTLNEDKPTPTDEPEPTEEP